MLHLVAALLFARQRLGGQQLRDRPLPFLARARVLDLDLVLRSADLRLQRRLLQPRLREVENLQAARRLRLDRRPRLRGLDVSREQQIDQLRLRGHAHRKRRGERDLRSRRESLRVTQRQPGPLADALPDPHHIEVRDIAQRAVGPEPHPQPLHLRQGGFIHAASLPAARMAAGSQGVAGGRRWEAVRSCWCLRSTRWGGSLKIRPAGAPRSHRYWARTETPKPRGARSPCHSPRASASCWM